MNNRELGSSTKRMHREIAVLGAGLMGRGIIELLSRAGHAIRFYDPGPTEHVDSFDHVHACASVAEAVDGADMIFEAIFEDLEAKHALYRDVEFANTTAPIASNTSTFVPSRLATGLRDASRLLIAHFFNPAAIVPIVELVPGPRTTDAAIEQVRSVLADAGKTVVVLHAESTGFVANRLQAALYREAMHLVRENIASPETVDLVMTDCLAPRWMAAGPFSTMDRGGLDVWQQVCRQIFPTLQGGSRAELIDGLVERGDLGAKTGAGFFVHSPSQRERLDNAISQAFATRGALRDTSS